MTDERKVDRNPDNTFLGMLQLRLCDRSASVGDSFFMPQKEVAIMSQIAVNNLSSCLVDHFRLLFYKKKTSRNPNSDAPSGASYISC